MKPGDLISDEYRDLNRTLHESGVQYGQRGNRHFHEVAGLAKEFGCKTILDYGCGKGRLARRAESAGIKVTNYDPAVPKFSALPEPHDLTVCTDVLEHVEPEKIDAVVTHLAEVTKVVGYFVIALRLDRSKVLPDGTNPHKLVYSAGLWLAKFSRQFFVDLTHPLQDARPGKSLRFIAFPLSKK